MAEWLWQDGIGERRAALIERGRLVEMAIEREDDPPLVVGTILPARLVRKADASGRGRVAFDDDSLAQLIPVPNGMAEGARLLVEVVREALPEAGGIKPLRVRPAPDGRLPGAGPDLLARLRAGPHPVRSAAADVFAEHGWFEAIEEAASGVIARDAAMLRIALTPAMTLIDVDGATAAPELAIAGAALSGRIIRRFGITGSIGIDLPTLPGKSERQAAAAALDAMLPPPFERTAVNGFGFLQLVRRRERPSLMERLAADPVATAALQLLATGERASGHGDLTLTAAPRVIAHLAARPAWIDRLARRIGAAIALREEAGLAISSGHVARRHP